MSEKYTPSEYEMGVADSMMSEQQKKDSAQRERIVNIGESASRKGQVVSLDGTNSIMYNGDKYARFIDPEGRQSNLTLEEGMQRIERQIETTRTETEREIERIRTQAQSKTDELDTLKHRIEEGIAQRDQEPK